MDTAAIMQHLDLVITSDTAMSHLAGALGVPTWVALTNVPDWRWLLDREDSPWYPTMRLFRQQTLGDWEGVFERMAAELKDRLQITLAGPAIPALLTGTRAEGTGSPPRAFSCTSAPQWLTWRGPPGYRPELPAPRLSFRFRRCD